MFKKIATKLWGTFESREEVKKFAFLALIFGLIIGTYWTMRPMKDSIFNAIVGGEHLWIVKILSIAVIAPLVVVYSKLIDALPRQKVFYLLISVYTLLTIGFMFAFAHPQMGLANTVPDATRYIGWAWYVFVESFGSLIVALFWVITTDITLPDAAKRGFPVIALAGQIGNIFGPSVFNTRVLGLANSTPIVGICAGLMATIGFLVWLFMHVTPKKLLIGYEGEVKGKKAGKEAGFFEGLRLLATNAYLLGIFFIVGVYEIIVTVIDYHFKQAAFAGFSTEGEISAFLAGYATKVGIVATLCVLFGINNIQRYLGMRASLLLLPLLMGTAVLAVKFNPESLTVVLWIVVLSKAINYALNQPTLKQLYIPVTREARYKTQGWIEMFGSRSSKGMASYINSYRKVLNINTFLTLTTIASIGLIGVWVFVALFVSKAYNKAIKNNEVVC